MAQTEGQRRASKAVAAWLAHHERNQVWLARQTEVDPGTIGDFLGGTRWPKFKTQGRIEKALGWPSGTIVNIADGGPIPPLDGEVPQPRTNVGGNADDADSLLYRRPEGMSDADWGRLKNETREYLEWLIEKASRER